MKKLFVLLLFPFLVFGQEYQRLGVSPTSLHLSKRLPVASMETFCSDGVARGIPDETVNQFKYFELPSTIEVKADGRVVPEGINSLIRNGDVIIETKGDDELRFKLSRRSRYSRVDINIKEIQVIANRPNDFEIAALWLNGLRAIKAVSAEPRTFAEAREEIKSFQQAIGIWSGTGQLTKETQDYISFLSGRVGGLIKEGYLDPNFRNLQDFLEAERKSEIVANTYANKLLGPGLIYKDDFYTLFRNGDNIELWSTDPIIARKKDLNKEVIAVEKRQLEDIGQLVKNNKVADQFYYFIGTLNNHTKSIITWFNGAEKQISWLGSEPYSEIYNQIKAVVAETPDRSAIILARDKLTTAFAQFDKTGKGTYGDAYLSVPGVDDRTWLNHAELARRLKADFPNKRIIISSTSPADPYRLANVPKIRSGEDIAAIIAPKSLRVYADQVATMKSKLLSSKISVLELDDQIKSISLKQSNILILSGHKDANFEAYLRALADKG